MEGKFKPDLSPLSPKEIGATIYLPALVLNILYKLSPLLSLRKEL